MKIRGGEMEKTFFPLTRLFETKKRKKKKIQMTGEKEKKWMM